MKVSLYAIALSLGFFLRSTFGQFPELTSLPPQTAIPITSVQYDSKLKLTFVKIVVSEKYFPTLGELPDVFLLKIPPGFTALGGLIVEGNVATSIEVMDDNWIVWSSGFEGKVYITLVGKFDNVHFDPFKKIRLAAYGQYDRIISPEVGE